jgi:hypothetical protein
MVVNIEVILKALFNWEKKRTKHRIMIANDANELVRVLKYAYFLNLSKILGENRSKVLR